MVTWRLAKPRPVQGEAGSVDAARRGTGYAARAAGQPAAERDGHPRQNPAYRPATENPAHAGFSISRVSMTHGARRRARSRRLFGTPGPGTRPGPVFRLF